jgi:hypothetical protein
MAGNNRELVRDIGANLQDRLPLDHSLPAVFVALLAELDASEIQQRGASNSETDLHRK